MSLPTNRPTLKEVMLAESTTSIATSPVVIPIVAPVSGYIKRGVANAFGATTGTITLAVSVNGGSDVFGGALTIPAGAGNANNPGVSLPPTGANAVWVNEGDAILVTPSGGTGATIPGAVSLVINAAN